MILLIDNYDSFSYNVYQLVGSVDPDIKVIRNDEMTVEEIEELAPSHIILSPGPGKPSDAGICEDVIRYFAGKIPILGICLGHQAICEVFGATVTYAKELMHGKQSVAKLDNDSTLFRGMEPKITVARYHSLAAARETMPETLKITAQTEDGEIMAVEHKTYPVYGVQFHPESVLTPDGKKIIENFCKAGGNQNDEENGIMSGNTIKNSMESQNRRNEKMIGEAIRKLVNREDIGYETAKEVMNEIMTGEATDVQKSAYLTALSMKGETIEEITGSAEEMRAHSRKLEHTGEVLEIVGTGGDGAGTFNISTTAAIVISAAGVSVAKHGNRAASSKSGAADCLEALGVNINIEPEKSAEVLRETGICFLFAQKYHTAMKYVGPIRKELGIRTVFNILGPLTNPACPACQVLGVYDESLMKPMAQVLSNLGIKRGAVVYALDKMDEISASCPTKVCEINNGEFTEYTVSPEDFGFEKCEKADMVGGTPEENARITREILNGEKGAKRNAVVMNAGMALYLAGKADTAASGVKLAEETIDSGRANAQLERFVQLTNN